jgi:hypothetical protein
MKKTITHKLFKPEDYEDFEEPELMIIATSLLTREIRHVHQSILTAIGAITGLILTTMTWLTQSHKTGYMTMTALFTIYFVVQLMILHYKYQQATKLQATTQSDEKED